MITTYADTSADEVYAMFKAIDESMDLIKASPAAPSTGRRKFRPAAGDAPWHEGTIRYMKEKGWWTAEHQAWQDKRMERLKKIQAGWADARKKFKGKDDEWPAFWEDYRVKTLGLHPNSA